MVMKLAKILHKFSIFFVCNSLLSISNISAQVIAPGQTPLAEAEDFTWWYVTLFLLITGLSGAVVWYLKNKKSKQQAPNLIRIEKKKAVSYQAAKNVNKVIKGVPKTVKSDLGEVDNFEQKLEKSKFSELPIARFNEVEKSRPFTTLPISNDEALMSAIEQTHDEFEEDESVRELAVRILARFKTRNSIEALSQVALYDLSSGLRSKAVGILADFDHESVFETLLLACADPTRGVRATAARGLFRLSFDRAGCWMRIAESNDEYRMRHAARAAIAGDLVEKSFDRLAHNDRKIAYEVIALIVLLIKSGETGEVFNALQNHPNPIVRKGILRVIKITNEQNALDELYNLLESNELSSEMRAEIDKHIEEIGLVPA